MTERTEVRARTVQGFCRAYGIGRTAAYELINEGCLQAKKFGKRTLIMEDSAKAWLASKPAPAPEPEPEIMDGLVYFIDDGFFIKIGFSKDPQDRIVKLQTASPFKLGLLCSIVANRRLEKELHQKFRHLKSHGEWFRGERELRQYIHHLGKQK